MSESVRYTVRLTRPHSHLIEVEAEFPPRAGSLALTLPVWTPGSYLVREYARHVQDFTAEDARGRPLEVRREDKQRWVVGPADGGARVRYRVYANELSVRTSHFDGTHAYFNGASVFVSCAEARGWPQRVRVEEPAGWRTHCALEREGDAWVAPDYDALVDSPFEVGTPAVLSFSAAGIPHEIVLWGEPQPPPEKLAGDLQRICETEAGMFGGLPMKRYVFFVYLTDKGRNGLEHRASTALLYPRFGLASPKGWEDFLTLVAHEYFHLWNVKRVLPAALVPFDYSQESYTSLLWAFEGATSYYDNLLVRRAGLMSPARYLTRLGETLTLLQSTPGRKVQTLAESSLTSWIKHYRPDENSPNSAISYYLKGEIVACLLDLELRRRTDGAKSLDDVMRLLWKRYGDGRGVPEEGVEKAAAEVAGAPLDAFFQRALRSTEELDYSAFETVGLTARLRPKESPADKGGTPPRTKAGEAKPKGWLGITAKGGSTLGSVLDGSPAMEGGLYADDDVLALDGYRVDCGSLVARCEDKKPGESVRITVFRRDKLLDQTVVLGTKPSEAVYLARVDAPTEAQKRAFEAWLGASWELISNPSNALSMGDSNV